MGQLNNRPNPNFETASGDSEPILKTVTQAVAQLTEEVARLQSEKSRLINEIETLQTQRQSIDSAPAAGTTPGTIGTDNSAQMLSALDATLNRTLGSLRQDLNSYQSSLSQQIRQMQNLEQQGEAILEALVSRLYQQLQSQAAASVDNRDSGSAAPLAPLPSTLPATPAIEPDRMREQDLRERLPVSSVASRSPSRPRRSGKELFWHAEQSKFRVGLLMVLLSTVALSLHNVAVNIIGNKSQIFGLFAIGGFIHLTSLGNALLILWARMLVVVPLMMTIAGFLYPPTWTDIRTFLQFKDRVLMWTAIGSGFFLFLSQVLIYTAISKVGPGVAVTILFMYPLVTVPLAWLLFKDQAQHSKALQIGVMTTILLGVVLTAFPKLTATTNTSWLGIGAAILSGIAFAFYLILMQISFGRKLNGFRLNPVPLSLIQFVTIFVCTSLSLIIRPTGLAVEVLPEGRLGLVVGGIVLGILTLAGYLLNNFGVRMMGAAQASILAAIGPVLTALLAFVIIPGPRTALANVQWLGIVVVTVGVLTLAFERLFLQKKAAKPLG